MLPGSAALSLSDIPALEYPRQGISNSTASRGSWNNQKLIYSGLIQHSLIYTGPSCCWTHQDLYFLLIPVQVWAVSLWFSGHPEILGSWTLWQDLREENCMCTNGQKKHFWFFFFLIVLVIQAVGRKLEMPNVGSNTGLFPCWFRAVY